MYFNVNNNNTQWESVQNAVRWGDAGQGGQVSDMENRTLPSWEKIETENSYFHWSVHMILCIHADGWLGGYFSRRQQGNFSFNHSSVYYYIPQCWTINYGYAGKSDNKREGIFMQVVLLKTMGNNIRAAHDRWPNAAGPTLLQRQKKRDYSSKVEEF